MARYKHIDTSPRFLAVDLERQLLPGTFEHALNFLIDHQIDLSGFDTRYRNDLTGAAAYPPGMMLKVVLFAYSQGIVSSRGIERACREHVTFIALCGDSAPHFTTIAAFVSELGDEVARLFSQVLFICDRQGLIQGYTGVAAVDDRHQIIVEAQAHGTGSEQELLLPVIQATAAIRTPDTFITADAGYHSDANITSLAEQDILALIADNGMRKRDERFKDQGKYSSFPIHCTTRCIRRNPPGTTGPRTSTTTRSQAPASAQPARGCIRTGPTASTTDRSAGSSRGRYGTACPATSGTNA